MGYLLLGLVGYCLFLIVVCFWFLLIVLLCSYYFCVVCVCTDSVFV